MRYHLIVCNVAINHYLVFTTMLFLIGICGIMINKKNMINILFSIEIMLLSANLNFIAFSKMLNDVTGQIFNIFILTIAAAKAAVGLAIIVLFFRSKKSITIENMS